MNDIIWRSIKKVQYPAVKKPVWLSRSDGKRPDGAMLTSWMRSKPSAWDITIPDTFANLFIGDTSMRATAAVDRAAANNTAKYTKLGLQTKRQNTCFGQNSPLYAHRNRERWCLERTALEFIMELWRRIAGGHTGTTEDTNSVSMVVHFFVEREYWCIQEHTFSSEH